MQDFRVDKSDTSFQNEFIIKKNAIHFPSLIKYKAAYEHFPANSVKSDIS
jgi:hypothetical protein